jgi:hypothetical protein
LVSSILSKKTIQTIFSLSLLATSNFSMAKPAFARYEEREGVFGEIKYARVCNQLGSINQVQIQAEAGARTTNIKGVLFKMYSASRIGVPAYGNVIGGSGSPRWKNVAGKRNINYPNGDMRWYQTTKGNPALTFSESIPIRLAIHVVTDNGVVIDLGGIVDLGQI